LLRAIENYQGEPITRLARRLIPYIFPRPIEFRTMEWLQINLNGLTPEWRVPWKRMKMREPHIVPLSRQAVEILREIQLHTGGRHYVFPQLRKPHKPMSENWITAALRAMGYSTQMSWHGFRALASTQLNELGWNDKWVEAQLSHSDRNKVRKAYNHAKYLPQRRVMMQAWADYIARLKEGAVSSWALAQNMREAV
jgi:integrase